MIIRLKCISFSLHSCIQSSVHCILVLFLEFIGTAEEFNYTASSIPSCVMIPNQLLMIVGSVVVDSISKNPPTLMSTNITFNSCATSTNQA
jgi:hypothetical protein